MNKILCGDALETLRTLPSESVHCCVTSPPYYGLRDYGVDGQIGLERTPEEYVAKLVEVFREVKRVLRDDGVLFLNLGDSYATHGGCRGSKHSHNFRLPDVAEREGIYHSKPFGKQIGLKEKDLIGIPWRVAFALQADGWTLRQEIIWQKPNPTPESVTDRYTKSHEQIFLFAKARWVGPPVGRFAHISDQDARWIALFIETEGNISIKRAMFEGRNDTFGCQIAVANSFRPLLEELQRIVGLGTILERKGKNWPVFYWQVGNKIGMDFLYRIYPFLTVKKRQAAIAIYLESLLYHRGCQLAEKKCRTQQENELLTKFWSDTKLCNKYGNPDLSYVPEPKYGRWDSARYYYDAAAIAEPAKEWSGQAAIFGRSGPVSEHILPGQSAAQHRPRPSAKRGSFKGKTEAMADTGQNAFRAVTETRNRRSVWTIATKPYAEAHFATFPPELPRLCILAGSPAGGIVLDPFAGAGTTCLVAKSLNRNYIGIELNPDYCQIVERRIHGELFVEPIITHSLTIDSLGESPKFILKKGERINEHSNSCWIKRCAD